MRYLWFTVAAALVGCSDHSNPVFTSGPLSVRDISVSVNPHNALSFLVAFDAIDGDSAQVQYMGIGDSSATPWFGLTSGHNVLPVLGLLPFTYYRMTLVVQGPGGLSVTPKFVHATLPLPTDLADAHITYAGAPSAGYTLISPIVPTATQINTYAMAFDTAGRVRWYREFLGFQSLDVQMQRNGHYTVGLNSESNTGREIGPFVELLPTGDSLATYVAPSGYDTDPHEIVLTGDSAGGELAAFWAYDTARTLDLTGIGGAAGATIYGHSLFRLSRTGAVTFSWDAWNHYGLSDWTEAANNAFTGDFDHPNSLALDADSNYIASFRNMDAIVKIDRNTGQRIWQLGGAQSTLTFVNDPLGSFSGQHFARRLANGHLLLYDDGLRHSPQQSRAVEYAIDTIANTATMVWQYIPSPAVFTFVVGSAQRLSNGNTVVGFGFASQIDEVDANSRLVSRGTFAWQGAKAFYRAFRLPSLYKYETP